MDAHPANISGTVCVRIEVPRKLPAPLRLHPCMQGALLPRPRRGAIHAVHHWLTSGSSVGGGRRRRDGGRSIRG
eukprot:353188-Chlamydomonas_euryale.AAC.1